MPSAEIIAVGTEILLGDIIDTNSQALGRALAEYGIVHRRRTTIGDHLQRCSEAISGALSRSDLVITIGGLGPTGDDVTRQAISNAVGEPLVVDDNGLQDLKSYVAGRGRAWKESFGVQAMRPRTATLLPNEVGTAPGIHWTNGSKHIIALPGPRAEFAAILDGSVRNILQSISDSVIISRAIRILDTPESVLAELFASEMEGENPTVSPYAKIGEVHLRITAKANDRASAEAMIDPVAKRIIEKLGDKIYSSDGKTLTETIIGRLAEQGSTIALAESCTGGMLAEAITAVPGSSKVFLGGIVAYSNASKMSMLSVSESDLSEFGAVSGTVCEQMANGSRLKFNATYGISTTGIAGPTGGTEIKPVGLVYIAVSSSENTHVEEHHFRGDRTHVREATVQKALAMLYREIS